MPPQLLDVGAERRGSVVLKPPCGGKQFVEVPSRDQMSFEVRRIDDFVRPEAFVRLFDAIMDACDYSVFDAYYPGGGRPAFPPKLLCKLLVYAHCVSVRSAREVSRRLESDLNFMWLAHGLAVDHETLSDFRRRFRTQIKDVFRQLVGLGVVLGLASLEHISLDGTKLAARAAREVCDGKRLQAALQRLDEHIDQLLAEAAAADAAEDAQFGKRRGDEVPQELQQAQARRAKLQEALRALQASEQDHIALGDPEAPLQKTPDGTRPGYNGQLAVDAETGFIVGAEVVTDQNDTEQFMPLAEQAIANAGQPPGEFAADSGYHSPQTLEALAASELNGYIQQMPTGKDGHFGHDDFSYDEGTDSYTCPAGKALTLRDMKHLRATEYRRYRAVCTCKDCPRRASCIGEKARYRELLVAPHEPLLSAMRRKVATPEGQQALARRQQTVERTFGTMKAQLGLRQLLLRGLEGARVEFTLCAMALNVRKLAQWLSTGGSLEQLREAGQQLAPLAHSLSPLRGLLGTLRRLMGGLRAAPDRGTALGDRTPGQALCPACAA